MDSRIIFIKTGKGEDEAHDKSALLAGEVKRALLKVDGTATFGEISKRAAPGLRSVLDQTFEELEKGGFIQDRAKVTNVPRMVVPAKMATPPKRTADDGLSELDFTAAVRAPSAEVLAAEAVKVKAEEGTKLKALQEAETARIKAEAEAKARAEAEARRKIEAAELKAQQEAEAARIIAQQQAARIKAEAEKKAIAEAEARREAAELKAQQAAEAARIKAEQEAARLKAQAEAKARAEAEAKAREEAKLARQKVAAESKAREEAEHRARKEAKIRAEAEAKAKREIEAAKLKAQQEAEAARIKAQKEAARLKAEAEAKARAEAKAGEAAELTRQKAAAEVRAREEAELHAKEDAERRDIEAMLLKSAQEAAQAGAPNRVEKIKPGDVLTARSTIATVLFFDVVGYTKQSVNKQIEVKKQFNQLLSDCLEAQGGDDRIILDTGDGAAIGFLQHPEDALKVAMQFRNTVTANGHRDFPNMKVRTGIHLGPVNIIRDVNGQNNMVGDGINDAQRVMSFAGVDQILISRSFYDFVSRLSDEYTDLFEYRGLQQDKHGREHPVYELVDALAPALPPAGEVDSTPNLEPFSFVMPEASEPATPAADEERESQQDIAAQLLSDAGQLNRPEQIDNAAERISQQPPPPAGAIEEPPKETAKPVAKAYMPSEEEVRKLAEAQAKTWAGAEQRAAAARAGAEQHAAAAQPHEAPQPVKDKQAARTRRKPIAWGKLGAGLFLLLLASLFAAPYLVPTQGYAVRIEQLLTARLQQPVHIGQLAGSLLPVPHLELSNISIGEAKQIQVRQAQVNFALSALFSSIKPISVVKLEGVQVSNADLTKISAWLSMIAADTQYPIALIKLSQGSLQAEGVQLSGIGGNISFARDGKFTQAKLYAEENRFALDLNATPENKTQASMTVRGALPFLPDWTFDELSASGELDNDEWVISNLDGRIKGGILLGSGRIGWRSGWQAQATLVAKDITLQSMSKVLNGDMDGTARLRMEAASLPKLVETSTMDGNFAIKKGIVNGVDIVETARLRSRENLPGGRTHFDELSGNLSVADGVYAFRQLKMNAGVLTVTGNLDIVNRQLSGSVLADLSMRAEMGSVALQVGGTADSPTLHAAP